MEHRSFATRDQDSQSTSETFTDIPVYNGISISMDGQGGGMDNVFFERLWRGVKYEEVFLKAHRGVT